MESTKIVVFGNDPRAHKAVVRGLADLPGIEILQLSEKAPVLPDMIFISSQAKISFAGGKTTRIPQNGLGLRWVPPNARQARGFIFIRQGVTPAALKNAVNVVRKNGHWRKK